jgi:hypothetical protein
VFPPPDAPRAFGGRLPLQFTRFFGREEEMAKLLELLLAKESRLVTLTVRAAAARPASLWSAHSGCRSHSRAPSGSRHW